MMYPYHFLECIGVLNSRSCFTNIVVKQFFSFITSQQRNHREVIEARLSTSSSFFNFSYLNGEYTRESSCSPTVITMTGSHVLATPNARQMVFILGNILPHCKSSFFRKCKIKQSYYIKPSNTLHISSRWLETRKAADKNASVPLERFCNPHLCLLPQLRTPPPKQLHLNMFPYKATKHDQPIWSDSLKFIGAVKTLMWESFLSAIHKTTTQKEYFLKKWLIQWLHR